MGNAGGGGRCEILKIPRILEILGNPPNPAMLKSAESANPQIHRNPQIREIPGILTILRIFRFLEIPTPWEFRKILEKYHIHGNSKIFRIC